MDEEAEDKLIDQLHDLTMKNISLRGAIASAPSVEEVLGKPDVYRAWLAKAQEALNG